MKTRVLSLVVVGLAMLGLGAGEVLAGVYANQVMADGAVGYWRLGEAGGATTALNSGSAGSSLNGTYRYSGGKTSVPGLVQAEVSDSAARFLQRTDAGVPTDHIFGAGMSTAVGGSTNPLSGSWTIEAWFVRDSENSDWVGIFSNNTNAGETAGANAPILTFFWGSGGAQRSWLGMNPAGASATPDVYVDLDLDNNLSYLGKTVYAALVHDDPSNTLTMYAHVEGEGWYTASNTSFTRSVALYDNWYIGRHYYYTGVSTTQQFPGTIDEVAVYDGALTAAQVQQHFGLSVPEPGTLVLLATGLVALLALQLRRR